MRFLQSVLLISLFAGFSHSYAKVVVHHKDFVVAKNDNEVTDEDTPATFDILSNDISVVTGPDPSTVDLDTSTPGVQSIIVLADGTFESDGTGNVTFTPSLNFNGTVSTDYTVDDTNGNTSNAATIKVTVNAVNDKPVITGQSPATLSEIEDQSFDILVSNLVISDPDNSTFTVTVQAGSNYTFSGNTVTPAANYNGPLSVNVIVSDGTDNSDPFGVAVDVAAVNDKPVITGQTPATISATEDQNFSIDVSNLIISDPDNSTFTITVSSGTNYTFSGNTIIPAANYNGPLTVNVTVNDGTVDSDPFGVAVSVAAVNDVPVITGQTPSTISATENQNFSLSVSNLVISDPDNSTFTLTVLPGTNYTFSGTTITPSANYSGPLSVNVQVSDGTNTSASFGVAVSVAFVDDTPVITGQTPATISATEDVSFSLSVSNLIISDADNTTFTMTVLPGTNYTFSGTTITPAANYNGPLTVNVTVNDGTNTSATYGVAVNVAAVNDKPVITGQSPATISATEDVAFSIALSNLIISDPDNATFTLTVLPGTNYTFSGTTITPASNYNGALTVNVKVNDGTIDSDPFGISVNVASVNDVPVITGQTPATISATEDQSFSIALSNLTISDPDNSSFTLTVLSGSNYTFSGTTITPSANYNGALTVNVKVNDGTSDSAPFGVSVNVLGVNDPPVITGQTPATISATEDQNFSIALSNLIISDPDNSTFTLTILSGTNYTFSGTTVTPASNYNGALTVNVKVNDGTSDSPTFGVAVSVAAVNDTPVITGQVPLSVNEDNAITVTLSNLIVTDPDNSYPTGFTFSLSAGSNYTVSGGNKITPSANFNGTLSVPVTVNDGNSTSLPFNLQITVVPINDPPVITGQTPLSTNENQPITLQVSQLTISDPDNVYPTDFTLVVVSGTNYSASGSVVTPAPNFNGTLTVKVSVYDGADYSSYFNLQITVNAVNNTPVITGQKALSVTEDNSITLKLTDLTVSDPDNNYPADFTLKILSGSNYTFSGTTITPAANFNGTLTVSVTVNDGTIDSAPFNVQISVTPVNDPPVITAQQSLSTNEDTPITIQFTNLTVTDPDNTYPTGFTLTVLAGSNYTFSGTTVTPAANFNGTLSVQVRVNDGTANSNTFGLQVTVTPVNDAPIITGQNAISTNEDTPVTIQLSNLIVSDPDNTYPTGFTLTVLSSTNATVSGNTVTPNANYNGALTVSVKVNDGTSDSAPHDISVTVVPVNDLPVIQSTPVNYGIVGDPYAYNFEATDVDGDALAISAVTKPSWATLVTISNGKAKLSGVPNAGATNFSVTIRVKDPSGSPVDQTYLLSINTRPTLSAISLTTSEDVDVNFQAQSFINSFTDADGNSISKIKITTLPKHGSLLLNKAAVTPNSEIDFASITQLVYHLNKDYNGNDTLYWTAEDNATNNAAYSNSTAYINFSITPVNDPPEISVESDTLKYEIGKPWIGVTTAFNVIDVDDDSLTLGEIGFRKPTFSSAYDELSFVNTTNITGTYDASQGVLTFSGKAPLQEYVNFVQHIQYRYTNTSNPKLETKSVYITLSDGKSLSNTKDRFIELIYTFQNLDIKNGFTPNDDGQNDLWEVIDITTDQQRKEDLKQSRTSIYDLSGRLIYEAIGFDNLWDGKYKGNKVPQGGYFYTIEVVDAKLASLKKVYKGIVNVIY